jgi:hypothetical protein
MKKSVVIWFGVVADPPPPPPPPSHGFGELRKDSLTGTADTGVGSVEFVMAVEAADSGV